MFRVRSHDSNSKKAISPDTIEYEGSITLDSKMMIIDRTVVSHDCQVLDERLTPATTLDASILYSPEKLYQTGSPRPRGLLSHSQALSSP